MTESFRQLFNMINERLPHLSINEILDVMFIADMRAYAELGRGLTKVMWVKTETGVRPNDLTLEQIMASL